MMKYNCRNSLKRFICNTPNIYGTVIITDNGTKYIGGVFMTSQQIFTIVFQLVLTGGIGIITYFLKRTMDDTINAKAVWIRSEKITSLKTSLTSARPILPTSSRTILPKRIFTENSLRLNRSWTRSWIS